MTPELIMMKCKCVVQCCGAKVEVVSESNGSLTKLWPSEHNNYRTLLSSVDQHSNLVKVEIKGY